MANPALTLLLLSPVAAALGLLAYFLFVRSRAAARPRAWEFFSTVCFWAVGTMVAAGIVDAAVVSTFLGERPFAIFVFGPPALAVGAVVGAAMWRRHFLKGR
jgi:hypothetical protein